MHCLKVRTSVATAVAELIALTSAKLGERSANACAFIFLETVTFTMREVGHFQRLTLSENYSFGAFQERFRGRPHQHDGMGLELFQPSGRVTDKARFKHPRRVSVSQRSSERDVTDGDVAKI